MTTTKIHAVVHVLDANQAIDQVRVAQDAGVDGVWLIDHEGRNLALRSLVEQVRGQFADLWVGVNFLGLRADQAASFVGDCANGLWSDNAYVHPEDNRAIAERARALRVGRPWPGLYFGGVAFKGQREEVDVGAAAVRSIEFVDVVTTSGTATGVSAPKEKIQCMAQALNGRRPLAIASGITPENVEDYLPYADYLMVATGVSRGFHEIDPDKLRRLVARVQVWHREGM